MTLIITIVGSGRPAVCHSFDEVTSDNINAAAAIEGLLGIGMPLEWGYSRLISVCTSIALPPCCKPVGNLRQWASFTIFSRFVRYLKLDHQYLVQDSIAS